MPDVPAGNEEFEHFAKHDDKRARRAVLVRGVGSNRKYFLGPLGQEQELKIGSRIMIYSGDLKHKQRIVNVIDLGNMSDVRAHPYRKFV